MKKKNFRHKSVYVFLLLSLFFSIGFTVHSAQADEHQKNAPITVYVNSNYEGPSQTFDLGEYDYSDLIAGIGNDKMSSIRIAQGYQVTLYENANFNGKSILLTADEINLKSIGFNDMVSSLAIEPIDPVDGTCIPMSYWTDEEKIQVMQTYAPRIWMAEGEIYWPSSVEYALPHLERVWDANNGYYYYTTKEPLSKPDSKLPFFVGDLSGACCYAFWVEKDYNNIDISYFQYCPYNYGKKVLGTEFGDHVGDWEHITIRFAKFNYEGIDYLKPIQIKYPSHNFSNTYTWEQVDKTDSTHAIGYCAYASHGMWRDPGTHEYLNIVVARLQDECSQGTPWDTWQCLETYEYSAQNRSGRGLGNSEWKSYFDTDYQNPDSLSVYQWGNKKNGSIFGQDRLGDGPTGPQEKLALTDYVIFD